METKLPTRQELHKDILREIEQIYLDKNADYGNSFTLLYKKYGLLSTVIRLSDKLNRLETLTNNEAKVEESIIDTLIDIANYSIMTVMEIRGEELEVD